MSTSSLRSLGIIAVITATTYLAAIPLLRILGSCPHPLITDITAQESGDIHDFYWKINQVTIARANIQDSLTVQFMHSVPNFSFYSIKTAPDGNWKKLDGDTAIMLTPDSGRSSFFIKATNLFGAETASFYYTVAIRDNRPSVTPHVSCRTLRDIPFRFEQFATPDMNYLQTQTAPVAASTTDEWQKYLALRSWVNATVPFGNPRRDSNWNAAEILKEIRERRGAAFLCDEHAAVFVGACISNGLNARMVYLRSETGKGHYAAEVWSNQQQKWVYMDPLYDFSYCDNAVCYTTLDLHNLYLKTRHGRSQTPRGFFPNQDYLNLFSAFQIIMANDFLSHPYQSVFDIISGRIKTLRWLDADTPRLNKWRVAGELILFYYVPKIGRPLILCAGFSAAMIVIAGAARKKTKRDVVLT